MEREANRQPAGFAIGGVAPVGQAPTIVLIGSGERLTGVLAAGHKLPRRTCEGSEQILLARATDWDGRAGNAGRLSFRAVPHAFAHRVAPLC
jgi:hypothetical protein